MKSTNQQISLISILIISVVTFSYVIDIIFSSYQNLFIPKIVFIFIIVKKFLELPLSRIASRFTGKVMSITIPYSLRKLFFGTFCEIYKVKQHDMIKPLEEYVNFRDFFTRQVKPRQIQNGIISPVDAKLLSISKVTKDECLLVKRINYKLGHFLTGQKGLEFDFAQKKPNTTIHSCILYLAPGDYHRYHCPVDFIAKSRLHIAGQLAPVKESNLKQGLYEGNERVVLEGEWEQGLMYIVFVGATNVGSMNVNFDEELITNSEHIMKSGYRSYQNIKCEAPYTSSHQGVHIKKGEELGYFNLGSTVVLIFESNNLEWRKKSSQKVRFGECIAQY